MKDSILRISSHNPFYRFGLFGTMYSLTSLLRMCSIFLYRCWWRMLDSIGLLPFSAHMIKSFVKATDEEKRKYIPEQAKITIIEYKTEKIEYILWISSGNVHVVKLNCLENIVTPERISCVTWLIFATKF